MIDGRLDMTRRQQRHTANLDVTRRHSDHKPTNVMSLSLRLSRRRLTKINDCVKTTFRPPCPYPAAGRRTTVTCRQADQADEIEWSAA